MRSIRGLAFVVALSCGKSTPPPIAIGGPAQPFGLVKDVSVGMTIEEVKHKAPRLEGHSAWSDASALVEGAKYTVHFEAGHVSQIEIEIAGRSEADLWSAWGQGITYTNPVDHKPHRRYFDPARGIRADVHVITPNESFAIELDGYVPLAKLLDGSDPFAVAGVVLIGRPIDQVIHDLEAQHLSVDVTEYKDKALGRRAQVKGVSAVEWSHMPNGVSLTLAADPDGTVRSWTLYGVAESAPESARAEILALYESKWGKPEALDGVHQFGTAPHVEVTDERLEISVLAHL